MELKRLREREREREGIAIMSLTIAWISDVATAPRGFAQSHRTRVNTDVKGETEMNLWAMEEGDRSQQG